MGRILKRVATDFEWIIGKVWDGYVNPWYSQKSKCYVCDGRGLSDMASYFYDQWYGNAPFDPVKYGSQLLTINSPVIKIFTETTIDRHIENFKSGEIDHCFYTQDGLLTRDEAIFEESNRLIEMFNKQWMHHLIQADVDALLKEDRLFHLTHVPLENIPKEQYIQTHAYYLWEKAGCPEGKYIEFWDRSKFLHRGYYLPYSNGTIPTVQQVNDFQILGVGINESWTCVKNRCEREGIKEYYCPDCKGEGDFWFSKEAKENCEKWKPEEPPTGEAYQIWETVSSGSPISPAFSDPKILAEWMANSPPWGAAQPMSAENWLKWILGPGWACSSVIKNGVLKDGVAALVEDL